MKQHHRQPHYHLRITTGLLISLFLSPKLFALGISDMTLLSKLGDPLTAQLQLTNTEDLSDAQILIRQATEPMYKKLGVESSSAYYPLNFSLKQDRTVVITTREPIKEPYLNFILEFRWPEGKLYKEFKLLIDPS